MILLGFVTQKIEAQKKACIKFGMGMDYLIGMHDDNEILTRMDFDVLLLHFDYSFAGYRPYYDNLSWYKWDIGVTIPIGDKYQIIPKGGMLVTGIYTDRDNTYFSHGIDFVILTKAFFYFDIGYNGVTNGNNYMPGMTFTIGLYLPKILVWEKNQ